MNKLLLFFSFIFLLSFSVAFANYSTNCYQIGNQVHCDTNNNSYSGNRGNGVRMYSDEMVESSNRAGRWPVRSAPIQVIEMNYSKKESFSEEDQEKLLNAKLSDIVNQ